MEGVGDRREEKRRPAVREMQISIAASVFPGFRFSPTDEELIMYYLKKKMEGCDNCVEIIPEVDFCRHEPWDLPGSSIIQSDNEWFFFSARGRKYPNGSQSRRATVSGYWKATGKERNVKSGSNVIGTKRTLVFHTGRAPKGERTEWIMHEYCMDGTSQDSMVVCRLRRNSDFHLNENPRRRSQSQRHLSDGHDCGFASSDGIPQKSTENGSKLSDGTRQAGLPEQVGDDKECTSSRNSHSAEQNDSESEANPRQADGSLQDGSSSFEKFSDGEDEWFADIMKDDIVKLDDSSLSTSQNVVPLVTRETQVQVKPKQSTMAHSLPCQGTADRRIRLRRQKVTIKHHVKANPNPCVDQVKHSLPKHCVVTLCTDMVNTVVKQRSVTLVLVIISFLVMFLAWVGGC